jgi:hypothetical protein
MINMSDDERDWDYMQRVAPWVYAAFHRIPRTKEAMGALFDTAVTRWEGDDEVDLTNKTLFGLLQLEVEAVQARVQDLEESMEGVTQPKGWKLLLRTKDDILYQSLADEVVAVPLSLAETIAAGKAFEGEVRGEGKYLVFSVGEVVLARIPRSLVWQLRSSIEPQELKEVVE